MALLTDALMTTTNLSLGYRSATIYAHKRSTKYEAIHSNDKYFNRKYIQTVHNTIVTGFNLQLEDKR